MARQVPTSPQQREAPVPAHSQTSLVYDPKKAPQQPPQPPLHRLFPYTPRAAVTFLLIHADIVLGLALAHTSVLPHHPHLLPLAFILPLTISFTLHHVISASTLPAYDAALRAALKKGSPRAPRAATPIMSTVPFCAKCGHARPPRTHHCRTCGRCTPRMSHHCGVLGVCVGAHNYKAFILLLVQGLLGTGLLAWHTARRAPVVQLLGFYAQLRPPPLRLLTGLQAVYVQVCSAVALVGITVLHMRLVAKNATVLETWTSTPVWQAVMPWLRGPEVHEPPHDRGLRRNVSEVFGSGWQMLVPVADIQHAVQVALTPHKPPI